MNSTVEVHVAINFTAINTFSLELVLTVAKAYLVELGKGTSVGQLCLKVAVCSDKTNGS